MSLIYDTSGASPATGATPAATGAGRKSPPARSASSDLTEETFAGIARHVFGPDARVASVRPIVAVKQYGITRVARSTRNRAFVVHLAGDPQPYVFRFSRDRDDDLYEQEVRNYHLLAEQTGVRVPEVRCVDRRGRLAPTAYMVLDFLEGDNWKYLTHPDNPELTEAEKAAIARETGRLYGRTHRHTRAMEPGREARTMHYILDRLEQGVERGHLALDRQQIDAARQAARAEPAFQDAQCALCLADSEIYFKRDADGWAPAFICDVEWVEYRHPYSDLAPLLAAPTPLWHLDRPLTTLPPEEVAARPFFSGYQAIRPLDVAELLRLAPYYQLSIWAYLAYEESSPEKKAWIRSKTPLIRALLDAVTSDGA